MTTAQYQYRIIRFLHLIKERGMSMQTRLIVKQRTNSPPVGEVNRAVQDLGKGWYIAHAETAMAVFGVKPSTDPDLTTPIHNVVFAITVIAQNDEK